MGLGKRISVPLFILCALAFCPAKGNAQFSRMGDQRQTPPELWTDLVRQRLEVGLNAARVTGNVDSTLVAGTLRYAWKIDPRNSLFLEGATAYNTYGGTVTLDKRNISALYTYALAPWLNAYAWSAHAQNLFLDLKYRTTNGAGLCVHGTTGVMKPVMFSLGAAPEYARYYNGEIKRKFRANSRLVFKIPVGDILTLSEDFIYFASFNDFADYRIYNEVYADLSIIADRLSYRLTVVDEYDNRPLSGIKRNDFTFTQGLVVHFGK